MAPRTLISKKAAHAAVIKAAKARRKAENDVKQAARKGNKNRRRKNRSFRGVECESGPSDKGGHLCYVAQSDADPKKNYCGVTGDLETRIIDHNKGGTKSTKYHRPWRCAFAVGPFGNLRAARRFELELKAQSKGIQPKLDAAIKEGLQIHF